MEQNRLLRDETTVIPVAITRGAVIEDNLLDFVKNKKQTRAFLIPIAGEDFGAQVFCIYTCRNRLDHYGRLLVIHQVPAERIESRTFLLHPRVQEKIANIIRIIHSASRPRNVSAPHYLTMRELRVPQSIDLVDGICAMSINLSQHRPNHLLTMSGSGWLKNPDNTPNTMKKTEVGHGQGPLAKAVRKYEVAQRKLGRASFLEIMVDVNKEMGHQQKLGLIKRWAAVVMEAWASDRIQCIRSNQAVKNICTAKKSMEEVNVFDFNRTKPFQKVIRDAIRNHDLNINLSNFLIYEFMESQGMDPELVLQARTIYHKQTQETTECLTSMVVTLMSNKLKKANNTIAANERKIDDLKRKIGNEVLGVKEKEQHPQDEVKKNKKNEKQKKQKNEKHASFMRQRNEAQCRSSGHGPDTPISDKVANQPQPDLLNEFVTFKSQSLSRAIAEGRVEKVNTTPSPMGPSSGHGSTPNRGRKRGLEASVLPPPEPRPCCPHDIVTLRRCIECNQECCYFCQAEGKLQTSMCKGCSFKSWKIPRKDISTPAASTSQDRTIVQNIGIDGISEADLEATWSRQCSDGASHDQEQ